MDALKIHDYFSPQAYLTREGKRYANCFVTPESVSMGVCEGIRNTDCEGGHKFTGPGTRRWSCWVIGEDEQEVVETATVDREKIIYEEKVRGEMLTGEGEKGTKAAGAAGATRSRVEEAFTAGVTGS